MEVKTRLEEVKTRLAEVKTRSSIESVKLIQIICLA